MLNGKKLRKRICHQRHRAICNGKWPHWTDFQQIRKQKRCKDGQHTSYAQADWYALLQNKQRPFKFNTGRLPD